MAVSIVAVTKGFGPDAVRAAAASGVATIGENYAQELLSKRSAIEESGLAVHFIGQLQRNKVRAIADVVGLWETVDRAALADELARRAPGARLLVQLDASGQPGKGGCPPGDVPALVEHCRRRDLAVEGLMTVGPTGASPEQVRPAFRMCRRLADELGLTTVSMGMSDDFEVAVEEGSTEVRVGTALFGRRP